MIFKLRRAARRSKAARRHRPAKIKMRVQGVNSMTPCAFPIDPAHPIPPVDCCLSFFVFFTQEKGGSSFWQPGAATPQKFGSQLQGVTSMTPHSPLVLVALTRRLPQVDCCMLFFYVFHDPREGYGGLRPPRAVLVFSSPNGDAWWSSQWLPHITPLTALDAPTRLPQVVDCCFGVSTYLVF